MAKLCRWHHNKWLWKGYSATILSSWKVNPIGDGAGLENRVCSKGPWEFDSLTFRFFSPLGVSGDSTTV